MKKNLISIMMLILTIITYAKGDPLRDHEYRAYLAADNKGHIYYYENIDTKLPLASTTKVMTMVVTFDQLRKGNVKLTDKVVISKRAAKIGEARIPMKAGQVFKLEDLIKAAAIHSANNAAYAVAEHVGKGYSNFIRMMNEKAEEIGQGDSLEFHTPAGLPPKITGEKMDLGSARGMYRLMLEARKYPEYVRLAGIQNTKIANNKIYLRNKNHLLGKEGIYGLKTGYHGGAGFNILVMGRQNNEEACFVVLGGKTAHKRDEIVLELNEKLRKVL